MQKEVFKDSRYQVEDYVKYAGIQTSSSILADSGLGRIEKFETFNQPNGPKTRVYLFLLRKQQHIWCDFDDLREIDTDEKHLNKIGFVAENVSVVGVKRGERFVLGQITVSGMILSSAPFESNGGNHFITRLCLADFTKFNVESIKNYLTDGNLDELKFFKDFPSVYNINRLFEQLDKFGIIYDKIDVINVMPNY